jgi:hypothetical protein
MRLITGDGVGHGENGDKILETEGTGKGLVEKNVSGGMIHKDFKSQKIR